MRKLLTNTITTKTKTTKTNKEYTMKLKSIVMSAMVAIMIMAGSAFAADLNTITSTPDQVGAAQFQFNGTALQTYFNANFSMADAIAVWNGANGTGLVGGMPQQVVYGPDFTFPLSNSYQIGTADALSGFLLNQTLFGMCGANCPTFVPVASVVITPGNEFMAVDSVTDPANTGPFNQARFVTGLVGATSDASLSQNFSQRTSHYSVGDGDYIDQRLASTITDTNFQGGTNVFAQSVQVCAGVGCGGGGGDAGAVDPLWIINSLDPVATDGTGLTNDALTQSGAVAQSIGDNNSGSGTTSGSGFGDYGQAFTNTNVINAGQPTIAADLNFNGPIAAYVPSNLPGTTPDALPADLLPQ